MISLTQIGLIMDAIGFMMVFIWGGFSFGVEHIIVSPAKWWVLPAKIIGGALVVTGFGLQFFGAGTE